MNNQPLFKFRQKLGEPETARLKMDGFLVANITNVQYLSGFTGHDTFLLITADNRGAYLITDFRYLEQAEQEASGFTIIRHNKGLIEKIKELAGKLKIKKLGFESGYLTYALVDLLRKKLGNRIELVPTSGIIEGLREIKTSEEIKYIREAVDCARTAFLKVKKIIKPGLTEKDLANELDYQLRRTGAENSAFGTIVAADERTSLPHARPTDKIITPHSAVLFDWGACCQGYRSDLTRVVFSGKIPPLLKKLYHIVAEAQQRAIDMIKPGVPIGRLDKIARGFIQKKGYGQYFGHGLGHGIGRDGHEAPRLKNNKNKLQPGMVMTIEPGIYLPGRGGIRIEDMALVTETGCELLTASVPKKLEEMLI